MKSRKKQKFPWFWLLVFSGPLMEILGSAFTLIPLAALGLFVYYFVQAMREKSGSGAAETAEERRRRLFEENYSAGNSKSQTGTAASSAKSVKSKTSGTYDASAKTSGTKKASKAASGTYHASSAADKDAGQQAKRKSILYIVIGAILLITSIGSFSEAVLFNEYLTSALLLAGSVAGFATGFGKRKKASLNRKYAAIIGSREWMALDEIAQMIPAERKRVEKDLQKLIDEGYFGREAYIDSARGVFYRSSEIAQIHADSVVKKNESHPVSSHALSEHEAVIAEIRRLNDEIDDPDVSARIDQIEQLTDSIYKRINSCPDKRSQITTFMDYYLPTTLKLLSAYSTFEDQAASGENIKAAKANIESILDTLVSGFSQQLDRLFESDAMDISGDIQVLEQMMARDGLTIGKGNIHSVEAGSPRTYRPAASSGTFSAGAAAATASAGGTAAAVMPADEPITLTLNNDK